MFFLGISLFGVAFMTMLAVLIKHDYPYVGEWFDAKSTPEQPMVPLEEQRATALHTLWTTVGIYGGLAGVCAIFVVLHKIRGAL